MPVVNQSKIVPYTQAEMYGLVNDIAAYSTFIPWCVASKVIHATDDEVRASLAFARSGFNKEFTTLNRLRPHKMIEITLINGPFKHLEGFWRFDLFDSEQSRVSLDLEFEFSSRWMSMMFGPIFNQMTHMLVDSFIKQAKNRYGER